MVIPKKTKSIAEAESRRIEIIRVAARLFCRHGVHAVSTRKIATAVGITQPSLYAHFSSLQAIQDEVSFAAFSLFEAHVSAARAECVEAHDMLKATIDAYLSFGLANPEAYRIAFMIEHVEAKHTAADVRHSFETLEHPGARAFALMRDAVAILRPELDAMEILCLSQRLWATLHGLVSLLIARSAFPWVARELLVEGHAAAAFEMVVKPASR